MILNLCLTQYRKNECFLYFRSLRFGISFGLASLSSFSLGIARASTALRSLMRQLHYLYFALQVEIRLRLGKSQIKFNFIEFLPLSVMEK